jgi:hypothetical protein
MVDELSGLHRLTDTEARLFLSFRAMSKPAQMAVLCVVQAQMEVDIGCDTGNVIALRPKNINDRESGINNQPQRKRK